MLENVVDVDECMAQTALRGGRGAAIFFDFAAAFPSLGHAYLMNVRKHLGLPPWLLRYVRALYANNKCVLIVAGKRFDGFGVHSGVRQGCPLSPLLFAVVLELLLLRLERVCPRSLLRAYADDICLVVPDLHDALPHLVRAFTVFASLSGMSLNFTKSIVVPLWVEDHNRLRMRLAENHPAWTGIRVQGHARYLGFVLGPERGELSWADPLQKVRDRAAFWADAGLGLTLSTVAWNVHVLPTMMFVAQLDALPTAWASFEAAAFRRLVPGPGQWCVPADLHRLDVAFGLKVAFHNATPRSWAAKCRVARWEAARTGGLQVVDRARALRQLAVSSGEPALRASWAHWLDNVFVLQLDSAVAAAAAAGVRTRDVESTIAQDAPRPWSPEVLATIRRQFQRKAAVLLDPLPPGYAERTMRRRLDRWSIVPFPCVRARRALAVLHRLRNVVPPRVLAALLRTWWNGWNTDRRLQRIGPGLGRCRWGCDAWEGDAIEHYSVCPILERFAARRLGLHSSERQLASRRTDFLLLDVAAEKGPLNNLVRRAILLATVYRCFNIARCSGLDPATATEALPQALRDTVRGHPGAMKVVDLWAVVA